MALSVAVIAIVSGLHLIAFVLAVAAERRRSLGKVVPDKYDERTYCSYQSDIATVYGLTAFGLLLLSQILVNSVTRCLCFGRRLLPGGSKACAVFFFIFSWVSFLGVEACLLAGSAKNAYHTKYWGYFEKHDLSCTTLRKGVFAAAAALVLLSLVASVLYYSSHAKANTGGWQKHQNEGLNMSPYTHATEEIGTQKP